MSEWKVGGRSTLRQVILQPLKDFVVDSVIELAGRRKDERGHKWMQGHQLKLIQMRKSNGFVHKIMSKFIEKFYEFI